MTAPRTLTVETPRLVEEAARGAGYRLVYALTGEPGAALLQRVETRVRALDATGSVTLEYEGAYEELVRLNEAGQAQDVHAFHVRRDGWGREALAALLRAAAPAGCPAPAPVARVELEKRFLLGLCARGPAHSGVLAGASAELVIRGPGWERALPAPAAPAPGAGQATWAGPPVWAAWERFGWGAASATGRLVRAGYQALETGGTA